MAQQIQSIDMAERTSTERSILEYLLAHRSATMPVLCRALHIRPPQAAWTIVRLEEQGFITSIARGKSRSFVLTRGPERRKAA